MTRPQCDLAELRRLDVDHHLPAHQDYKLMRHRWQPDHYTRRRLLHLRR